MLPSNRVTTVETFGRSLGMVFLMGSVAACSGAQASSSEGGTAIEDQGVQPQGALTSPDDLAPEGPGTGGPNGPDGSGVGGPHTPSPVPIAYAAIAYSQSTRSWGASRGYPTMDEANAKAVEVCSRTQPRPADCAAVITTPGCGSLALGSTGWGAWQSPTAAAATSQALATCQKYATDCATVVTLCAR